MKRYNDHERPNGVCYDCRDPYNQWPDMVLDNELWEKINPTYHEGAGLLCPICIVNRLLECGVMSFSCEVHYHGVWETKTVDSER